MDNYIVRIYRRQKDDPRMLIGLVEEVGIGGKRAFNTFDDLWEILNTGPRKKGGKKVRAESPQTNRRIRKGENKENARG